MTFPIASVVSQLLTNTPTEQIFNKLCDEIKKYHDEPAHSLADLKDRDRQKLDRGNAWEIFCKEWLIATGLYNKVWLLNETPADVRTALQLAKVDVGIDLIIQVQDKPVPEITKDVGFSETSNYIAVQAKFRSKPTLNWAELTKFVGLTALTGPWQFGLITTNCEKIGRREVPVRNRFKASCKATFIKTSRAKWCQIAGLGVGKHVNYVAELDEIDAKPVLHAEVKHVVLTPEQLRQKRLQSLGIKP